jgi:hypothetical protein
MSIPLVQNNEKDSINTSIIAIKRNIERINMLLGLVDNDSPDLSGFATKQELQDAVTELQPVDEVTVGNMQSVTSNAVATIGKYVTTEQFTGKYWINGKPIYRKVVNCGYLPNNTITTVWGILSNVDFVVSMRGIAYSDGGTIPIPYFDYESGSTYFVRLYLDQKTNLSIRAQNNFSGYIMYAIFEYTKTTD